MAAAFLFSFLQASLALSFCLGVCWKTWNAMDQVSIWQLKHVQPVLARLSSNSVTE